MKPSADRRRRQRIALLALAAVVSPLTLGIVATQSSETIALTVDASRVAEQSVLFAHERVPAKAGPITLYYPQWVPGEHMPAGPLPNLADLVIKANGATVPWRREPLNMYAFDLTVPPDADHLDIDMTYLGSPFGSYSSNRLASSNIAVVVWDQTLLYPSTGTIQNLVFKPSLVLPGREWQFATALTGASRQGNQIAWDQTTLEHLVDSPVDMGTNFRRWEIWHRADARAYLNVFADRPEQLEASEAQIAHYTTLVDEMFALYGARHWRDYNFLLTVSDVLPGEGVEHHESSDDGTKGDLFSNPKTFDDEADLLSHELNHSWNGKYRMPEGLYRSNLNLPYEDSLLWVYEGMTQYYGQVMSWRDGIRDANTFPDHVAATYAFFDQRPGRAWRSLGDTAVSGPFLYNAPRGYQSERRAIDFYQEGELMWLKVDSIIRDQTGDRKSLDTFAREFFGQRDTGPVVQTYKRQDVIDGLSRIAPYDWPGFFATWIDRVSAHPPDGFTADGWKLVYTDQPQHFVARSDCWYSIGLSVAGGNIIDVRFGSPAWTAGLGINFTISAVNGRDYSDDALAEAIKEASTSKTPITLLVKHAQGNRDVAIDYHDGPKYPHLVRIPGTADRLSEIIKPRSGR